MDASDGRSTGPARCGRIRATLLAVVLAAVGVTFATASPAPAQVPPTVPPGVTERLDLPYGEGGAWEVMDVYLPPGAGAHPGVLLVHGGGFVAGDKVAMRRAGLFLAANGYVGFSINYRLAPDSIYPAAVQDAQAAVTYMRAHAGEFHLDPRRVGALGSSSGGSIVASLGTTLGRGSNGSQVAAVAAWSGIMDMFGFTQDRPEQVNAVTEYVYGTFGQSVSEDSPELRSASPISHVTPDDPPMFLANSLDELVPHEQADAMAAGLRSAGVEVEQLTPTQGHAVEYEAEADAPTLAFFDRFLRTYPGSSSPPSGGPSPTATTAPSGPNRTAAFVFGGIGLAIAAAVVAGWMLARRRKR